MTSRRFALIVLAGLSGGSCLSSSTPSRLVVTTEHTQYVVGDEIKVVVSRTAGGSMPVSACLGTALKLEQRVEEAWRPVPDQCRCHEPGLIIGTVPERTFLRTIEGGGTYRFAWVREGDAGREAVSPDFEVRGPYAPPPPRHGVVAVTSDPHPPADGSSYLRGRVIDEQTRHVVSEASVWVSDGSERLQQVELGCGGDFAVALPRGTYEVTVTLDSFTYTVSRVPLERGQQTEIQLVVASPCEEKYEPLPCK